MSAMSTQKRKIAIKHKERMAIIRAAQKPEEYLKHRAHQKALLVALNEDFARAEHGELLAVMVSS